MLLWVDMVFLDDANLFNVLRKGYEDLEDMMDEVKSLGKAVDKVDLEESV